MRKLVRKRIFRSLIFVKQNRKEKLRLVFGRILLISICRRVVRRKILHYIIYAHASGNYEIARL